MDKFVYMKALRGRGDLTHAEFRVLTMMWNYADEDCSNVWPGPSNIADDGCIKDGRRVRRYLKSLEAKGYLVVTSTGGSNNGRRLANEYRLTLPQTPGTTGPQDPRSTTSTTGPQDPRSVPTTGPHHPGTQGPHHPGTQGPQDPPTKSFIKSSNKSESFDSNMTFADAMAHAETNNGIYPEGWRRPWPRQDYASRVGPNRPTEFELWQVKQRAAGKDDSRLAWVREQNPRLKGSAA